MLRREDFELVRAHLAKYPRQDPCPICHSRQWTPQGLQAAPGFSPWGVVEGGEVTPILLVACTTCGYIRHFAWLFIVGDNWIETGSVTRLGDEGDPGWPAKEGGGG